MWYILLKIIFKAKCQNEKYEPHLNTKKMRNYAHAIHANFVHIKNIKYLALISLVKDVLKSRYRRLTG